MMDRFSTLTRHSVILKQMRFHHQLFHDKKVKTLYELVSMCSFHSAFLIWCIPVRIKIQRQNRNTAAVTSADVWQLQDSICMMAEKAPAVLIRMSAVVIWVADAVGVVFVSVCVFVCVWERDGERALEFSFFFFSYFCPVLLWDVLLKHIKSQCPLSLSALIYLPSSPSSSLHFHLRFFSSPSPPFSMLLFSPSFPYLSSSSLSSPLPPLFLPSSSPLPLSELNRTVEKV